MNSPSERARIIAANKQDLATARESVAKWTDRVFTIQRTISQLEIADAVATRREEREALEAQAQADAQAAVESIKSNA